MYANKKLLNRCEYFDLLFHGGFREVEGNIEDDYGYGDEDLEVLSDSDQDDELEDELGGPLRRMVDLGTTNASPLSLSEEPTTPGMSVGVKENLAYTSGDVSANVSDGEEHSIDDTDAGGGFATEGESGESGGEGAEGEEGRRDGLQPISRNAATAAPAKDTEEEVKKLEPVVSPPAAANTTPRSDANAIGPKKTRIVVRDAAWSTWWAVLYWVSIVFRVSTS